MRPGGYQSGGARGGAAPCGRARRIRAVKTPTLRGSAAAILVAMLTAPWAAGAEPAQKATPPAASTRPAKTARPAKATSPAKAAAAAPATRLLVTIVVDQLAAWIAAERWPELPPDGGFARLRREGLYVRELRYDHAVTDTAPGHSALYTGAVPRDSGIIGNDLIRESDGATVSILTDPRSQLLVAAGGGVPAKALPGASLAALTVDTLADVLARRDGQARIYSFSLKDRGALFGGGTTPDARALARSRPGVICQLDRGRGDDPRLGDAARRSRRRARGQRRHLEAARPGLGGGPRADPRSATG